MVYSTGQLITLALAPKIAATISIPCSLFIIHEVLQDQRQVRKEERHIGKPVDRALLGMSVIDVMAASGWWYSTFLMPKGSPNAIWTTGNTQTCTFQGFLLQIAIGAPLYNCSLSLYYLLQIRYGWSHAQIAQRLERWVHLSIISFSLITALAGIPLEIFNPVGSTVCWISALPQGCSHNADLECERGEYAWILGFVWFDGLIWICVPLTIIAMVLVYGKVQQTHKALKRQDDGRHESSSRKHLLLSRHPSQESLGVMEHETQGGAAREEGHHKIALARSKRRERQVATQAILYSMGFFITWMPSTVWSIMGWFCEPAFLLDLISGVCEPTQGLVNMLIFIRIRPNSRRKILRMLPCLRWCFGDMYSDDDLDDVDEVKQDPNGGERGGDVDVERSPVIFGKNEVSQDEPSMVYQGLILRVRCSAKKFMNDRRASLGSSKRGSMTPHGLPECSLVESKGHSSQGREANDVIPGGRRVTPAEQKPNGAPTKQFKSLTAVEIEMGRSTVDVSRDSAVMTASGVWTDDIKSFVDDEMDRGSTINASMLEHQEFNRKLDGSLMES